MMPAANSDLQVLSAKVDQLTRDSSETRAILKELTTAITRMLLLEERQSNDREAIGRAFDDISLLAKSCKDGDAAMSTRVKVLEERSPINNLTSNGLMKVVGLIVAAVLGAQLNGLFRTPPPTVSITQTPSVPTTSTR